MEQRIPGQAMSSEDFLIWIQTKEQKFELVDGQVEMMAGANQDHNDIGMSGLSELTGQLKGKPCRPIGPDSAVQIPGGNIRFPDFGIDCGKRNGKSMLTTAPALVVEVLSPSTRLQDFNKKLNDYKTVVPLNTILLVEQDAPRVHTYQREQNGFWSTSLFEGLDAVVPIPELNLSLPLGVLYERIEFPINVQSKLK